MFSGMLKQTLLLLALGASFAHAQAPDSVTALPIGTQARLFTPNLGVGHWRGTVVGQTGDTLLLSSRGSVTGRVPIGVIDRVEVRRGSNYVRGVGTGVLAGAAVLGGVYLLQASDSYQGVQFSQLMTSLAWGAGLGGFVGFVVAPSRWETVFRRSEMAR